MIRFRFREDEARYLQLLSEVYQNVAVHLPPPACRTVLRNLGKLHDQLWLEGVRQGVAAAAISNTSKLHGSGDLEHLKAFQLHAHVYGSQDTPMRDAEVEWLERLGVPQEIGEDPWLDPEPMRFAPDTEATYEGRQAALRAQQSLENWSGEEVGHETAPDVLDMGDGIEDDGDFDAMVEQILADGEDNDAQERPELLDRIRELLVSWSKEGVKPRDWEDLILRLHMTLHVDAGFLDIQLGTPMGQTVLAQAGFFDLHPGPFGTNLSAIKQAAIEASAPTAPEEGASGE